ncbi:hypothetical protein C8Q73DRAFT_263031 [Cubamyces lactineus]|nr:hypothetical protein C8Q73DRAFT_263031 [Cubamyces lactineus]
MKETDAHTERRWSELVPPHTGLTFAAIWDPEEGMVTFSGAHLFDSGLDKAHNVGDAHDSPYDVPDPDNQSQVLTIDRFAMACAQSYPIPSAGMDSFAYARDALVDAETVMDSRSCLAFSGNSGGLRVPPGILTVPDSPAAASSMALASLVNVPFRKSLVKELVERGKQAYHLRTRRPEVSQVRTSEVLDIDPYGCKASSNRHCAESDETFTDEGFYEGQCLTHAALGATPVLVDVNLSSAFSVTTTSTSRYVEVDYPRPDSHTQATHGQGQDGAQSQHESSWTTLRDVERDICFNVPLETGRRLKKPRSNPSHWSQVSSRPSTASPPPPANPAEVLARRHYNHVSNSSSHTRCNSSGSSSSRPRTPGGNGHRASLRRTKELLQRVVNCKRSDEDERWVCVEVQHKVTQRVCTVEL